MIRIRKAVAGTISSLALLLGMSGTALAQSTSDTSKDPPAQPDTSKKGTTSAQGSATPAAQEKMDKEKAALKDRVQQEITAADANIDALKKMSDNDKGSAKKRDEDMEKKLSDLRSTLQDDMGKIDKAQSASDWNATRPVIEHDLQTMTTSLRTAQTVTKVPRTGAASKQPPSGGEHHETPQPTPAPQQP
jgi:hypothetical protein